MSTLIHHFQAGGFFMYFILAVGFAVIGITVERALALYKNHKEAPKDLRQRLMSFIAQGQFHEAISYIEMTSQGTSIGQVAAAGFKVRVAGGGDEEVQARMDEALAKEISIVDRRTGFLAVFGNVATLLGLLGTVTGMIVSFASVSTASPAERALLLGAGIAEALNATAFGLIVAIPALMAFAFLQNRADRLTGALTESSSQIFHDLLFHSDSRRHENMDKGNRAASGMTEGSSIRGN